jgi:DNA mismatch repair protein MutS
MANLTPMMQQYLKIKEENKDSILFFRLGDFYEMFFEDAKLASKELEITLTGRDCGQEERAPMCGVPFHSADSYIAKLVNKGYKVAICEQVEDPATAKGIVKRDVVRIITPGTITDSKVIDEKRNNFLACIFKKQNSYGISFSDVSTGELYATELTDEKSDNKLIDELERYNPSELICNKELLDDKELFEVILERYSKSVCEFKEWSFEYESAKNKILRRLNINSLSSCGLDDKDITVCSIGALLEYLDETQKVNLKHINNILYYSSKEYMDIDSSTRRNLELTETMRDKEKKGSLLWVLDKTNTAMGARLMRKWIEQPLLNCIQINKRLNAVNELYNNTIIRADLRDLLKEVYDIERLLSKIVYGSANCRDLVALKKSISFFPQIKDIISSMNSALMKESNVKFDALSDIKELIEEAIIDDPPFSVREGGIIKDSYSEDVARLRNASVEGKTWIAKLEDEERKKTGIKKLKVSYNKVFGYYLEITKSYFDLVPDRYIRKQTLANSERYITPELKKIEDIILGAEDKVVQLEYSIFCEVREKINQEVDRIQKCAKIISLIDVLCSLSEVAKKNNYVMPIVDISNTIEIRNGRHPVVEKMMKENMFIPNNTYLDNGNSRLAVITGPNMAGKSTYMRQAAIITLMAQIGSFVPAETVTIGIVDKIFTRVGASDNLALGQSTFMVEMSEVANILHNATNKSLLILDEIGRGTSTFDGLSIAWAVIEYVSNTKKIGAKTLFATHYHELTELENKLEGVKNYCISVKKRGDDIIFLRRIIRGGADDSYGIEVAKLAGIPDEVINRAKKILKTLEESDINKSELVKVKSNVSKKKESAENINQIGMISVDNNEIIEKIRSIDISTITPIEALNLLFDLQNKAKIYSEQ